MALKPVPKTMKKALKLVPKAQKRRKIVTTSPNNIPFNAHPEDVTHALARKSVAVAVLDDDDLIAQLPNDEFGAVYNIAERFMIGLQHCVEMKLTLLSGNSAYFHVLERVLDRLCLGQQKVLSVLESVRHAHYDMSNKKMALSQLCRRQSEAGLIPSHVGYFTNRAQTHRMQSEKQREVADKLDEDLANLKCKLLGRVDVWVPLQGAEVGHLENRNGSVRLTARELVLCARQNVTAADIEQICKNRKAA